MVRSGVLASLCLLAHAVAAVKVKVVMHSDQEDSKIEEEEGGAGTARPDLWEQRRKRIDVTMLPFLKRHDKPAALAPGGGGGGEAEEGARPSLHPNDMLFPLIYRQSHINSMFKFGENWYTWSTEKRTDGSRALNYYICYDEPKRCDDVGWERTDSVPKCAFEIDSVLPDDRACLNAFGVEPRAGAGGALCDGADQMKVSEIVRSCGSRVRSLWRFVRVGRRSPAAAKPADVNSLVCEDEEECFLTIEYRIHHDRITFSLHEPTRGQTYKSVLKRDPPGGAGGGEEARRAPGGGGGGSGGGGGEPPRTKFHPRVKSKPADGKGLLKERNDSGYNARRTIKNKIKIRDDVSDDISDQ